MNKKGKKVKNNIGENIIKYSVDKMKFCNLDTTIIDERFLFRNLLKYLTTDEINYLKEQIKAINMIEIWQPKIFNKKKLVKFKNVEHMRLSQEFSEFSIPIFTKDNLKCILLTRDYETEGTNYAEILYIKSKNDEWEPIFTIFSISS